MKTESEVKGDSSQFLGFLYVPRKLSVCLTSNPQHPMKWMFYFILSQIRIRKVWPEVKFTPVHLYQCLSSLSPLTSELVSI